MHSSFVLTFYKSILFCDSIKVRKNWWNLFIFRLCGTRGITAIAKHFEGFKLQGKYNEKIDLDIILSKMEHWAHRLFPQLPFDDSINQIAKLGSNRSVQVFNLILWVIISYQVEGVFEKRYLWKDFAWIPTMKVQIFFT